MSNQNLLYDNAYDIKCKSLTAETIIVDKPIVTDDIDCNNLTVNVQANINGLQAQSTTTTTLEVTDTTTAKEVHCDKIFVSDKIESDAIGVENLTAGTTLTTNLAVTNNLTIPHLEIAPGTNKVALSPTGAQSNIGLELNPKGNGPLTIKPSSFARGVNALDLQMVRSIDSNVAGGQHSSLIGGHSNYTATTATNGIAVGGFSNAVVGPESGCICATHSTIGGVGSLVVGRSVNSQSDGSLTMADGTTELAKSNLINNSAMFYYSGGYYFRRAQRFDIDDNTQRHNFSIRKEFHNTPTTFFDEPISQGAHVTITANLRSTANSQRMIKRTAFINPIVGTGELTYKISESYAQPVGALNTCGVSLAKASPNRLVALSWGTGGADVYFTITIDIVNV